MACAVRVKLNGGNAQAGDMLGIHLPGDVSFDYAYAEVLFKPVNQRGDQAGLSGSRTSHYINHADLTGSKGLFYLFAYILIPVHYLMQYFDLH